MDAKLTGKIIAEKRKEKGLNQIQLAELLNVSNRTISKWENGDGFPDITLLPEISECLGISIDELLTGNAPALREIIIEKEADNSKKHLHEFKLLYILALFLAAAAAILGGVTEVYSMWAFPSILFYTHWEIMFAAVSLAAEIVSALAFVIGIVRLQLALSAAQIISHTKFKSLILFIILSIFPLSFFTRIIDVSRFGVYMPYVMAVIIALLAGLVLYCFKRIKNEKN